MMDSSSPNAWADVGAPVARLHAERAKAYGWPMDSALGGSRSTIGRGTTGSRSGADGGIGWRRGVYSDRPWRVPGSEALIRAVGGAPSADTAPRPPPWRPLDQEEQSWSMAGASRRHRSGLLSRPCRGRAWPCLCLFPRRRRNLKGLSRAGQGLRASGCRLQLPGAGAVSGCSAPLMRRWSSIAAAHSALEERIALRRPR